MQAITEELPLFRAREAARATDPITSVEAAESVAHHVRRDRLAVLAAHYRNREGLDDFQLAEMLGRKQTSVGKRRGDLMNPKYFDPPLIEAGERRRSPSSLTNSVVMVWKITEAGVSFYRRHLAEREAAKQT